MKYQQRCRLNFIHWGLKAFIVENNNKMQILEISFFSLLQFLLNHLFNARGVSSRIETPQNFHDHHHLRCQRVHIKATLFYRLSLIPILIPILPLSLMKIPLMSWLLCYQKFITTFGEFVVKWIKVPIVWPPVIDCIFIMSAICRFSLAT